MSKQFAIFFGVGVAVIAIAVVLILSSTKGSHLVINGKILKVRTGALSDNDSIAVMDLRMENPSNLAFVVRQVEVTLEEKDGTMADGLVVAKGDLKQLFQFNRFLGDQYNDSLTIKDQIAPHATVDRMLAARFEVKKQDLEAAKAIHVSIQDMDGPLFETTSPVK
ncbi:MAG TPA: hypothetical protein VNV82_16360 [Bryobacteraceae bacterium]|jgi:hypothetical protein|nr:hypothetical protein [Bryobacteraceae bacterium]